MTTTSVQDAQSSMNTAVTDCLEAGLDIQLAVTVALNSVGPGRAR
jgi:hypothetical protein